MARSRPAASSGSDSLVSGAWQDQTIHYTQTDLFKHKDKYVVINNSFHLNKVVLIFIAEQGDNIHYNMKLLSKFWIAFDIPNLKQNKHGQSN